MSKQGTNIITLVGAFGWCLGATALLIAALVEIAQGQDSRLTFISGVLCAIAAHLWLMRAKGE